MMTNIWTMTIDACIGASSTYKNACGYIPASVTTAIK